MKTVQIQKTLNDFHPQLSSRNAIGTVAELLSLPGVDLPALNC